MNIHWSKVYICYHYVEKKKISSCYNDCDICGLLKKKVKQYEFVLKNPARKFFHQDINKLTDM